MGSAASTQLTLILGFIDTWHVSSISLCTSGADVSGVRIRDKRLRPMMHHARTIQLPPICCHHDVDMKHTNINHPGRTLA